MSFIGETGGRGRVRLLRRCSMPSCRGFARGIKERVRSVGGENGCTTAMVVSSLASVLDGAMFEIGRSVVSVHDE